MCTLYAYLTLIINIKSPIFEEKCWKNQAELIYYNLYRDYPNWAKPIMTRYPVRPTNPVFNLYLIHIYSTTRTMVHNSSRFYNNVSKIPTEYPTNSREPLNRTPKCCLTVSESIVCVARNFHCYYGAP